MIRGLHLADKNNAVVSLAALQRNSAWSITMIDTAGFAKISVAVVVIVVVRSTLLHVNCCGCLKVARSDKRVRRCNFGLCELLVMVTTESSTKRSFN